MKRLRSALTKLFNLIAWKVLGATSRSARPTVLHIRHVPTGRGLDEVVWRTTTPAVVEPGWGYVIVEPRLLCMNGFDALKGNLPPWTYAIPSASNWVSPRHTRARRIVDMDRVVSLRHLFEWNYYHFFFDVLGKLALLDQLGLLSDLPVIVGPSASELRFSKELMTIGEFANVNWYVQPRDVHIRAREVTFCRSRLTHAERAMYILDRLHLEPISDSDAQRKVLLIRRPPGRQIINLAEIETLTSALGFETVDTADWPLREQIELFRRTRTLVAIHGAGLTNLIFRAGQPMNIIELCSDVFHSEDFRIASEQLGFEFTRLRCPAEPARIRHQADFRVDPKILAATLRTVDI